MTPADTRTADSPADAAALVARNRFIVLVSLLQGLALYLVRFGADQGWPWIGDPFGWITGYTLVLAAPSAMTLTVLRLNDRLFWQHAAGIALLYAVLGSWAAWNTTGVPDSSSWPVLARFAVSVALGLFVLLPYLQCRLEHRRWCAPYADLFNHAWQNGLSLALLLPFVGLCWLVLLLWGALFSLVKIDFFQELFERRPFIYLATGTMVGFGILVARTQQRPVQVLQLIVFSVFRGLLPVLSFIALLFVAMLPFTGLEPLWQTRRAAVLLLLLVEFIVIATNAVYLDGRAQAPYPPLLKRLVQGGLLTLPVFAALAAYAVWLRVEQYGWTPERVCGGLLVLLMAGHAIGYAFASLSRGERWLAPLSRVNLTLSLIGLVLVVLVNTPVLDPTRIGVASQLARLDSGVVTAAEFDYDYLRRETGRYGYEALQALREHSRVKADADAMRKLEHALADEYYRAQGRPAPPPLSVEQARERIARAPQVEGDERWWQQIAARQLPSAGCLQSGSDCVLLEPDLDGDGVDDLLLCDLKQHYSAECLIYARDSGGWMLSARLPFWGDTANSASVAALRQGRFETQRRRWPDLLIDGRRMEPNPCENDCGPLMGLESHGP